MRIWKFNFNEVDALLIAVAFALTFITPLVPDEWLLIGLEVLRHFKEIKAILR